MVRGLMPDEEWALFAPLAFEGGPRRGRRHRDHRLVMDGVLWIARTGSAWRDLTITSANRIRSRSVPALGPGWGVGRVAGGGERDRARPGQRPDDGFHYRSRPLACRSCPRKRQALKAKAVAARAWLLDQDSSENQRPGPVHRHCPDRRRGLRRQTLRTADGWARPCSKVLMGDKGNDADTILADLDTREAPPSSRPNATARFNPPSTLISTPCAPC